MRLQIRISCNRRVLMRGHGRMCDDRQKQSLFGDSNLSEYAGRISLYKRLPARLCWWEMRGHWWMRWCFNEWLHRGSELREYDRRISMHLFWRIPLDWREMLRYSILKLFSNPVWSRFSKSGGEEGSSEPIRGQQPGHVITGVQRGSGAGRKGQVNQRRSTQSCRHV